MTDWSAYGKVAGGMTDEEIRLMEAVYASALAFMSNEREISNLQKAVNALKKYRKKNNG